MRRSLGIIVAALLALIIWVGLVATNAREGWSRTMPAAAGDTSGFLNWAKGRYEAASKGNFAIVLLKDGQPAGTYFASHGRAVDGASLFQVASLSKWLTAWGVMTLVEQHRIDLDAPVSRYLTRWHLPPSEFNNDDVTVRRLLSHSAGLTDGLGFRGFAPDETLPTVEEELTHARDAQPGASGITRVGARPAATWRYSGGGYLLLQLLIEEVAHEPFNDYMRRAVFLPLGMTQSTFMDPDPAHLADVYDAGGSKTVYAKFTALAAASLYTSTSDMTRFLQAQHAGGSVLTPATLDEMRKPQAFLFGIPVWGLGASLFAPDGAGSYVTGHDGNNYPSINTTARIDPATGDGIIVLETGNPTLAAEIGGEWVFWHKGTVGLDTMVMFGLRAILIQLALGALVILLGAIMLARRGRRRAV